MFDLPSLMPDDDDRRSLPTALRGSLDGATGPRFWRSLEELADTPDFRRWLESEFPTAAACGLEGVSRRRFLTVMAASFAMAGLTGCRQRGPADEIVPYVREPEEIVPGRPLFYATALTRAGWAQGVLVESHMGRPTKIEGNPDHPASLGSTDIFAQAAVLSLWDPDRSQTFIHGGSLANAEELERELRLRRTLFGRDRGAGLRLLTGAITSPSQLDQIGRLQAALPGMRWHVHEPLDSGNARRGAAIAVGRPLDAELRFRSAQTIVCLDADPFFAMPGSVAHARGFADGRRMRHGDVDPSAVNRLYVAEPTPTVTGASADHRLPLSRRRVPVVAAAVAARLGIGRAPGGLTDGERAWVEAAAADLAAHRGRSLLVAGDSQPADVHAVVLAVNAALGNVGRTVVLREREGPEPGDLRSLAEALRDGEVDTLVVIDANPVFDAPVDLEFGRALAAAPLSIHLGLYRDETGHACTWHLPMAHELERWGDARAFDGRASIVQPLIEPLYDGLAPQELLASLLGPDRVPARDTVRSTWRRRAAAADFEAWWRAALERGVVEEGRTAAVDVAVDAGAAAAASARIVGAVGPGLELVFTPDATVWDGRWANNAWLQELPKPITMLTWDNALLMAPGDAGRLGLGNEDVVEVELDGRVAEVPVWVVPGQAEGSVALSLGYGRSRAGRVGSTIGTDGYRLRSSTSPWVAAGVQLRPTGRRRPLATTQHHHAMENRDLVRVGTVSRFVRDPGGLVAGDEPGRPESSFYPDHPEKGVQWGMAIDLTACVGCGVCTIACQAENNIPTVGKEQVRRGREMHWIRVDRYFEGGTDSPGILHQPVPCMHCEKAPCEVVCPVGATQHSRDGLNEMVYNRCVGTRYCSNNCPYKVRRFNFYRFVDASSPTLAMQRNPDVSVRGRGVMEKCTYCVQRIRGADAAARREGRPIRDGEVVTACQAACPTRAIVFGDIADPDSRVSHAKRQPHDYGLLTGLDTRPRTSYLARIRNPAPDGEDGA